MKGIARSGFSGRHRLFQLKATTAVLTLCLYPSLGIAAPGQNTLVPRVEQAGPKGLCYQRVYDPAHLRRHTGQTIGAMTVLLKPETGPAASAEAIGLAARIDLRNGSEPLYGMAACWWEVGANRIADGGRATPEFKSDDGTRCMSMVEPTSAEEAGDFFLDATQSGESLLVYNGFSQMRSGPNGARFMRDVEFGPEDAILRLDRVDRARCDGIEDVLAEPVKAQNR